MSEFDPSKPVMTRGGLPGLLGPDGSVLMDVPSQNDLLNIPESKWMNLYEDPKLLADMHFYTKWSDSRADADKAAVNSRATCGAKRIAIVERTSSGEFITTAVEK